MVNRIKQFFNLDRAYEFDITDITALIYTICAIGVIMGADMTILFFIGSTIATLFCLQSRRINLGVLNVALWFMNLYYFINLIWG